MALLLRTERGFPGALGSHLFLSTAYLGGEFQIPSVPTDVLWRFPRLASALASNASISSGESSLSVASSCSRLSGMDLSGRRGWAAPGSLTGARSRAFAKDATVGPSNRVRTETSIPIYLRIRAIT